jgi:hypothetical protein
MGNLVCRALGVAGALFKTRSSAASRQGAKGPPDETCKKAGPFWLRLLTLGTLCSDYERVCFATAAACNPNAKRYNRVSASARALTFAQTF